MTNERMYYIVDTRSVVGNCAMFWGKDRAGYVCNLNEAGRYSEDEAKRQQRSRSTDVAVPCDVIDAIAVTHVRGDTMEWRALLDDARSSP